MHVHHMSLRTACAWMLFAVALITAGGCSSSSALGNANQRPYDFEARILHPRCAVLPVGIDSVDVYLEWSREEALFLRNSPQSPFTATMRLKAGTFETEWTDTLTDYAPKWDLSLIHI